MKPKAKSQAVQEASRLDFGLSIPAPDGLHAPATLLMREIVYHVPSTVVEVAQPSEFRVLGCLVTLYSTESLWRRVQEIGAHKTGAPRLPR
jgi:hypothetical protein